MNLEKEKWKKNEFRRERKNESTRKIEISGDKERLW